MITSSKLLIPFKGLCAGIIPSDEQCFELWDYYQMLPNIRIHSMIVANIATYIGKLAQRQGCEINLQVIRAAGLLHDLAKTYTVNFGGNHSQIGATWVMDYTKNPAIAQGVIHHVYWPGEIDIEAHFLPLSIIYADKRVKHDKIVSLRERNNDILKRYGNNPNIVKRIQRSFEQVQYIEQKFKIYLKVDLNAYPFDRWRMVE